MKTTETFEKVIDKHLKEYAEKDQLFAEKLKNPKKNIKDCTTYILNQVKNSGMNGFADEEVYGMAIHYYDEENIEVGAEINAKVVINHNVPLTNEDIKNNNVQALTRLVTEVKKKLSPEVEKPKTVTKSAPKAIVKKDDVQPTLF